MSDPKNPTQQTAGTVNIDMSAIMLNGNEAIRITNRVEGEIHPSLLISANRKSSQQNTFMPGVTITSTLDSSTRIIPSGVNSTTTKPIKGIGDFEDYEFAADPNNPGGKDKNSKLILKNDGKGNFFVSKTTLNPNTNYPGDIRETIYTRSANGDETFSTIYYRVDANGNTFPSFPESVRHYDIYSMEANGPAYEGHMQTLGDARINGRYAPNTSATGQAKANQMRQAGRDLLAEVQRDLHHELTPITFPAIATHSSFEFDIDPQKLQQTLNQLSTKVVPGGHHTAPTAPLPTPSQPGNSVPVKG